MSSKGIEPFVVKDQYFYREPPLPIGSPTLKKILLENYLYIVIYIHTFIKFNN